MTQALARKWRPRGFSELTGQEHVVRALANALDRGRLHHAWLFTGTRGVGKTTLARILAKALNCERGVSSTPCGVCDACRSIDAGRFVDLIELDAASNTQVDNMRELLENAMYSPTAARFKVYIIDEVHMLSRSAFNAMLKTLEEPPEHVKFILATTDPQKIPVTVLSRCLQFNLKNIPPPLIASRLEHVLRAETIDFDAGALALIARAAQGSLRDALSLTDQAIAHGGGRVAEADTRAMLGVIDQGYLFDLLDFIARGEGAGLIAEIDALAERGVGFEVALRELASILHRVAVIQRVPEALREDDPDAARWQAVVGAFDAQEVQLNYQIAIQGVDEIGLAPDEQAGFTMALLRMLAFAPETTAGAGGGRAESGRPESAGAPSASARPTPTPTAGGGKAAAAAASAAVAAANVPVGAAPTNAPSAARAAGLGASGPAASGPGAAALAAARSAAAAQAKAAAGRATAALQAAPPGLPPEPPDEFDPPAAGAPAGVSNDGGLEKKKLTRAGWADFVASISLSGMARMLAQHTELGSHESGEGGARIELVLPTAHQHLLEKAYQDKLQQHLARELGGAVQLRVRVGAVEAATPAEIALEREQTLQSAAVAAIEADPFVRELIERFDARLDESRIAPKAAPTAAPERQDGGGSRR
jgi:DNA polymerase III subunit gamma/tau